MTLSRSEPQAPERQSDSLRGGDTAGHLEIDLDAIAANYRLLRRHAGGARTAGVVKANGYGLGAVQVARRLAEEGCDLFFVAHLNEALELRDHGHLPGHPDIAVLNGVAPGTEQAFASHNLIPVLNTLQDVERWVGAVGDHPAILQVETGMNRLGMPADEWETLLGRDALFNGLNLFAVMSHLACADDPDHPLNARQIARFREIVSHLRGVPASLANSAATLTLPETRFDIARPGIALYGSSPLNGVSAEGLGLAPVVRLRARILQVRTIDTGESVGYGATYVAPAPRRIATVSTGYADGLQSCLGHKGMVRFRGYPVPLAGRVSMDLLAVDITDALGDNRNAGSANLAFLAGLFGGRTSEAPDDELAGDDGFVELIAGNGAVDALAEAAGTIGYEILTALGQRYSRQYLTSEA